MPVLLAGSAPWWVKICLRYQEPFLIRKVMVNEDNWAITFEVEVTIKKFLGKVYIVEERVITPSPARKLSNDSRPKPKLTLHKGYNSLLKEELNV